MLDPVSDGHDEDLFAFPHRVKEFLKEFLCLVALNFFSFKNAVKSEMDEDEEDEWESAADNFQIKVSTKDHDTLDDEWEGGTDGFFATSDVKNHLAGAPA